MPSCGTSLSLSGPLTFLFLYDFRADAGPATARPGPASRYGFDAEPEDRFCTPRIPDQFAGHDPGYGKTRAPAAGYRTVECAAPVGSAARLLAVLR